MTTLALLSIAILFGGMVFFSFGFAPVLFAQLPSERVRPLLRGTFPYYYLVVIAVSTICAAVAMIVQPLAAALLLGVCLSTVYARQDLMGRINAATDRGDKRMFGILHGLSVVIQLIQIGIVGWALILVV
ncbi:hypothetical protein JANAI62_30520 [Jannaschia pagri]|uniref:TMEM205-like domain-containing protein n=1 Tax=Jannaschia pagri TaxID=2829797 RepID=A0ABQ4NPU5_9RHOB|nr:MULTISPECIES: DUF4149 domain-containing protein [unclassified Jannaschia]GIT92711.1 hypothetical protein JANAI61_31690 [Jannaschia sp. AI_61]GIT96429.1 hypothetical protein JANAI62_30520 [Jannaschia sp. AI_62]